MADNCCAGGAEVMILACSGGSNVGQLSNQAAVELTGEGFGKMFCLAGIGGKLSGFVQSARDVPQMVVIDGCQVGCARASWSRRALRCAATSCSPTRGSKKTRICSRNAPTLRRPRRP